MQSKSLNKKQLLKDLQALLTLFRSGELGGEKMPEDARPDIINPASKINYHFLTLPMGLNYQRNSYTLWQSAAESYKDKKTSDIFDPDRVVKMTPQDLREKLLLHKVALQPNRHVDIWRRLCDVIVENFSSDIRNLFDICNNDVVLLKEYVQQTYKKSFPYLSGHKIFNYWLHVIEEYTPTQLMNREEITIAPDTHIIQASIKLGVTDRSFDDLSHNREELANLWKNLLHGTGIAPIDIHTPLWLWSRSGFKDFDKKI